MTDQQILVTRRPPGRALDMLAGAGDVDVWDENRAMPETVLRDRIRGTTGLYGMLTDAIDTDLLGRAPKLLVVSQMAVGVDNVDIGA